MTEYARLHAENQMRMMEATISVSLNKMSSSLSAWQDALNGAYEAQMNAISRECLKMMTAAKRKQISKLQFLARHMMNVMLSGLDSSRKKMMDDDLFEREYKLSFESDSTRLISPKSILLMNKIK